MADKFDAEKDKRLVELYQENRSFLDATGNSSDINKKRKLAWEKIASTINIENKTSFNADQCKKRWQNLKSTEKSAKNIQSKAFKKTGGGESEAKDLTSAQEAVVGLLGESRGFQGEPEGVETPVIGNESCVVIEYEEETGSAVNALSQLQDYDSASSQPSTPRPTEEVSTAATKNNKHNAESSAKKKKRRLTAPISDEDLRQKQMQVLEAQLADFEENACLRQMQIQVCEKQMAVLSKAETVLTMIETHPAWAGIVARDSAPPRVLVQTDADYYNQSVGPSYQQL